MHLDHKQSDETLALPIWQAKEHITLLESTGSTGWHTLSHFALALCFSFTFFLTYSRH